MRRLRTGLVVPVRGHSALLGGAMACVRAQTEAVDDVVVVDDAPTPSLEAVPGARVLHSGGVGPYAARNVGWRALGCDVVLFLDARSRPRPEWAATVLDLFEDPEVGFAGSDVRVLDGPSWAARTAAAQQIFALGNYVGGSVHRPYFPTCGLAVRRSDLERVGGFAERRSGGDADLCWRIQAGGVSRAAWSTRTLVDWVPRDRLRDYVEQYYRYGRSGHLLRRSWAHDGASPATPPSWPRIAVRSARLAVRTAAARLRGDDEQLLADLVRATSMAYAVGLRVGEDADSLRGLRELPRGRRRQGVE